MFIPKKYEHIMSNATEAYGIMTKEERRAWEFRTNRILRNVKPLVVEKKTPNGKTAKHRDDDNG